MKWLRLIFRRGSDQSGQTLFTVTILTVAVGTGIVLFAAGGGGEYQSVEKMTQESETLAIADGGEEYTDWVQQRDVNWSYTHEVLDPLGHSASYPVAQWRRHDVDSWTVESTPLSKRDWLIKVAQDETFPLRVTFPSGAYVVSVLVLDDPNKYMVSHSGDVTRVFVWAPTLEFNKAILADGNWPEPGDADWDYDPAVDGPWCSWKRGRFWPDWYRWAMWRRWNRWKAWRVQGPPDFSKLAAEEIAARGNIVFDTVPTALGSLARTQDGEPARFVFTRWPQGNGTAANVTVYEKSIQPGTYSINVLNDGVEDAYIYASGIRVADPSMFGPEDVGKRRHLVVIPGVSFGPGPNNLRVEVLGPHWKCLKVWLVDEGAPQEQNIVVNGDIHSNNMIYGLSQIEFNGLATTYLDDFIEFPAVNLYPYYQLAEEAGTIYTVDQFNQMEKDGLSGVIYVINNINDEDEADYYSWWPRKRARTRGVIPTQWWGGWNGDWKAGWGWNAGYTGGWYKDKYRSNTVYLEQGKELRINDGVLIMDTPSSEGHIFKGNVIINKHDPEYAGPSLLARGSQYGSGYGADIRFDNGVSINGLIYSTGLVSFRNRRNLVAPGLNDDVDIHGVVMGGGGVYMENRIRQLPGTKLTFTILSTVVDPPSLSTPFAVNELNVNGNDVADFAPLDAPMTYGGQNYYAYQATVDVPAGAEIELFLAVGDPGPNGKFTNLRIFRTVVGPLTVDANGVMLTPRVRPYRQTDKYFQPHYSGRISNADLALVNQASITGTQNTVLTIYTKNVNPLEEAQVNEVKVNGIDVGNFVYANTQDSEGRYKFVAETDALSAGDSLDIYLATPPDPSQQGTVLSERTFSRGSGPRRNYSQRIGGRSLTYSLKVKNYGVSNAEIRIDGIRVARGNDFDRKHNGTLLAFSDIVVRENDNRLVATIGGLRGGNRRLEAWIESQDGVTVAGPWMWQRGSGFAPITYREDDWNVGGGKYRLLLENNGVSLIRISLNGIKLTEGNYQNISGLTNFTMSNLLLKGSDNDLQLSLAGYPSGPNRTVTLKLAEGGKPYDDFVRTNRNVVTWSSNSLLITPKVISNPTNDPIYIYVLNPDENIVTTQFRIDYQELDASKIMGLAGLGPEKWREIF